MTNSTVTLQALLQFALPLGTSIITGNAETSIHWAITVRAQPPAFPEIYGGELALVSMDILQSYDSRITLADVIEGLANAGITAVAVKGEIAPDAVAVAGDRGISLLALPDEANLTSVERAVNTLIVNQSSQLNQRALEIQRQLTRMAAENRDLNSLLQIMARATAKPVIVHDDAGVVIARVYPNMAAQRGNLSRNALQNLPFDTFQTWLNEEAPTQDGIITASPLGFTTVLKVEKRVAGYLSLVTRPNVLEDFDRLVLTYGSDVCAIEMAKNRAIASAVERTRGDWVQMWLSGTPADDDLMTTRAHQAGFDADALCVVAVFRAVTHTGTHLPLEALTPLVRDDMSRRGVEGAVGQYVDVIVALYPLEDASQIRRTRQMIDEIREQLSDRSPSGLVAGGISRPARGLTALREAYREAKDALGIANELGDFNEVTFYGDLKLYQLLLALKEYNLEHMRRFYEETLGPLVGHDERKHGDLLRTLEGFFEANGNLAKAAQDLDVHRNTLVYRLERIGELTELDLDDADNRLILHLALKIQRVLALLPGKNNR
jgi:purine catabolism regulator